MAAYWPVVLGVQLIEYNDVEVEVKKVMAISSIPIIIEEDIEESVVVAIDIADVVNAETFIAEVAVAMVVDMSISIVIYRLFFEESVEYRWVTVLYQLYRKKAGLPGYSAYPRLALPTSSFPSPISSPIMP